MKNSRKKGFSLLELMAILVIITVLVGISFPLYTKVMKRSKASDALNVLSLVATAQEKYYIQNSEYTDDLTKLALPIKKLNSKDTSDTKSGKLDNFEYTLGDGGAEGGRCVYAQENKGKYTLTMNYENNKIGCAGEDCQYIKDLVDEKDVGCAGIDDNSLGKGSDPIITSKSCSSPEPERTQVCNGCGTQTRNVSCNTTTGNWEMGSWGACDKTTEQCSGVNPPSPCDPNEKPEEEKICSDGKSKVSCTVSCENGSWKQTCDECKNECDENTKPADKLIPCEETSLGGSSKFKKIITDPFGNNLTLEDKGNKTTKYKKCPYVCGEKGEWVLSEECDRSGCEDPKCEEGYVYSSLYKKCIPICKENEKYDVVADKCIIQCTINQKSYKPGESYTESNSKNCNCRGTYKATCQADGSVVESCSCNAAYYTGKKCEYEWFYTYRVHKTGDSECKNAQNGCDGCEYYYGQTAWNVSKAQKVIDEKDAEKIKQLNARKQHCTKTSSDPFTNSVFVETQYIAYNCWRNSPPFAGLISDRYRYYNPYDQLCTRSTTTGTCPSSGGSGRGGSGGGGGGGSFRDDDFGIDDGSGRGGSNSHQQQYQQVIR